MVNYRRTVCEVVALTALVAFATAAPIDCDQPHAHTHYDQRQNGTENYRLNIDGVVIAVAPAETLMSALSDMDDLFDFTMEDFNPDNKPKPPSSATPEVASLPEDMKPQESLPLEEKPSEVKPLQEKPLEDKPQENKPEGPLSDVSLSSDLKSQKKEAPVRKHEKAQRLKNRLASFLVPLLRKTRHH